MIQTVEKYVKRLLSLLLPVTNWRVPVSLKHGLSRSSGHPVTLLAAGMPRVCDYIALRLFKSKPRTEPVGMIPVWKLTQTLNRLQASADLTVVGVDRLTARRFFDQSWLQSPAWIASWMPVPEDLQAFAHSHSRVEGDMRYLRRNHFGRRFSVSKADFDTFYDHFYKPYIARRHGSLAYLRPRWSLRRQFKRGGILWIHREEEVQAADIVYVNHRTLHRVALGIADGRMELLQQRALAALYVHSIGHARDMHCTEIFLGGSRPFLYDGVFQYKRKWGAVVCEHPEVNYRMLLRWNRLEGPVAEFLSHSPVIHYDGKDLSGLWSCPPELCRSAELLEREIRQTVSPGLRRLRVLLPDEPPPGYVCPPDVELVSLQEHAGSGPEALRALK
ncbi:hypothetical protein [Prosthecobacter sp.]|uniref:hypothetical protein n=1 Tax=Prosthecobacter sp. TaxID=1965333 RepID=UPI001D65458D|nr:hypothetical protein [Prosthecobacter sp.]MCB1278752.1 hypothetical protein [Prosthecobacter sp.]